MIRCFGQLMGRTVTPLLRGIVHSPTAYTVANTRSLVSSLRPCSPSSPLINLRRMLSGKTTYEKKRKAVPLLGNSSIAQAVQQCCDLLGRKFGKAESELISRLEQNWYNKAEEVAAMSEADGVALRVPLRLLTALRTQIDRPRLETEEPAEDQSQAEKDAIRLQASTAIKEHAEDPAMVERIASGSVASALEAPAVLSLPDDIMSRRCPDPRRFGHGNPRAVKVTTRKEYRRYAIREQDLPPKLKAKLKAFKDFLTTKWYGQLQDPILPVTANKYADHIRQILGWLHHHQGIPLTKLSFAHIFPNAEREGVKVVFEYMQWLVTERGINSNTEGVVTRSMIALAKFMFHSSSKIKPGEGQQPYTDLEMVRELRGFSQRAARNVKVASRTADEALKWLDWPAYLRVIQELKKECAGLNEEGTPRPKKDVALSLQRYLLFAILSSVPDRQRTLRELEVGRTLVKENGRWLVKHTSSDYKTGKAYGERPPLVIAPHLYPELDAFLGAWREELGPPKHALLFSQASGGPLTLQAVHRIFSHTAWRLSGKMMNPHLVRDMIVTYLRGSGASERELEALAIYMGHSMAMQRGSYDRRTKAAKVEPAVDLLASINKMALQVGGS